MTEPELLPCPFCGGEPIVLVEENTACWYVECNCEAQGPHESTDEQAIAAWNTRPAPATDEALVEVVARAFRAEEKLNWNLELGDDEDVADLVRIAIAAMHAHITAREQTARDKTLGEQP